MKRIISLITFTAAFVTLFALSPARPSVGQKTVLPATLAQSIVSQDDPFARAHSKTCSVGTLKGDYGYLIKGNNLNWLQLPSGPVAMIGVANYDGAGNVTTTATSIFNGFIVPVTQKGTYTVNDDCTGEVVFPLGGYPIVITSDGREIRGIQTYPSGVVPPPGVGWVLDGYAKKIAPEPHNDDSPFERAKSFSCNPGVIAGSYSTTWNGTMLSSPTFPAGPMSGVSIFNFSQDLTFASKDKMNFNGIVTPLSQAGTFTLQDNCMATVTIAPSGDRIFGVFVDGGNEFFAMELPPAGTSGIPGFGGVLHTISRRTHSSDR